MEMCCFIKALVRADVVLQQRKKAFQKLLQIDFETSDFESSSFFLSSSAMCFIRDAFHKLFKFYNLKIIKKRDGCRGRART